MSASRREVNRDEFTPYRVRKDLERLWRERDKEIECAEQARIDRLAEALEEKWPDMQRKAAERKADAEERERSNREAFIKRETTNAKRYLSWLRNHSPSRPRAITDRPCAQIVPFPRPEQREAKHDDPRKVGELVRRGYSLTTQEICELVRQGSAHPRWKELVEDWL